MKRHKQLGEPCSICKRTDVYFTKCLTRCLECNSKSAGDYWKKRYKEDPEWAKLQRTKARHRAILRLYGITEDEFMQMVADSNNRCPICVDGEWGTNGPVIDHDHTIINRKDSIRGILCGTCNRALGQFGDSIEGLMRAVAYLAKLDPPRFERALNANGLIDLIK